MQIKAELTELVGISRDIKTAMDIVLSETGTVKEINVEVKSMRAELEQARAAIEAVNAKAEITASKLSFLESGVESLFYS